MRLSTHLTAASCTSVVLSGVGDLDGTYTEADDSFWDYYAVRLGGIDIFEIVKYGDTWTIQNMDGNQYEVGHVDVGECWRPTSLDAVVVPRTSLFGGFGSCRAVSRASTTRIYDYPRQR